MTRLTFRVICCSVLGIIFALGLFAGSVTHYPYALPDEPADQWPRISGVHGVFKHLDDEVVGGKLLVRKEKFFNNRKLAERQPKLWPNVASSECNV